MKNTILSLLTLTLAGTLYAGASCCPVSGGSKEVDKKEVASDAKKECGCCCHEEKEKKDCESCCDKKAGKHSEKPSDDKKAE